MANTKSGLTAEQAVGIVDRLEEMLAEDAGERDLVRELYALLDKAHGTHGGEGPTKKWGERN